MSDLLLTFRHNITLEADVALSKAEIAVLCSAPFDSIRKLGSPAELDSWLAANGIDSNTIEYHFVSQRLRPKGTVAFVIGGITGEHFQSVIKRAAFVQEALFINKEALEANSFPELQHFTRERVTPNGHHIVRGIPITALLEYSAPLVFRRDRISCVSTALSALTKFLLDETPPPLNLAMHLKDATNAKKTTLYLSHELHLYKGKFFPRLVRSLINRYALADGGLICDPFAGSGTALLEASLLGHRSVGIDVDPTSVLISQNKTTLADVNYDELTKVCKGIRTALLNFLDEPTAQEVQLPLFPDEPDIQETPLPPRPDEYAYTLSQWEQHVVNVPEPMRHRLIKRGSEEGYDLLGEIENDSAKALCLIAQVPDEFQSLLRVCLSHALTKKIRLRFVGVGNGRFTFDVAKVQVFDLFLKKTYHLLAIAETFRWLQACGIQLGEVQVRKGSAINIDSLIDPGSVDLVITSPPYIPASSGREHYARARAIPLVFTGAATVDELEELDRQFIGEMSGQDAENTDEDMPETVRRTLSFLSSDQQRQPKYAPTLQYYKSIREILRRVRTTLAENGIALFVVAKSHTFYVHKTKTIVHTVDAARAMCEIGMQAGLDVVEIIDVPLKKSGGLNARPRSTDEYAEAVIVFRRG